MNNDIQENLQLDNTENNHNKFLKNVWWLAVGKAGYILLSFLVTLTVVRYLGPYDFGTINYVDAYVKFAVIIATFGLDVIVVKEVAAGKKDGNKVLWTALIIRLVLGTVLGIGITCLMYITDGDDPDIIKIAVLESILLVFTAFHSFFEFFQARLLSKWNAIAEMSAYLGTSIFRVILLVLKADVVWFAFATSLDMIILVFILGTVYVKKNGFHPTFNRAEAKSLMSQSWYYMIAGLLTVAFTQIDRIMIEKIMGRTDLGEYSVTINFMSLWIQAASVLTQAAIPVIHKAFLNSKEMYLRRLRQSYAVILWMNLIFAALVCIFARPIILVFYGESYLGAVGTLRISVWHYGLSTVALITQAHLSNEKKGFYIIWLCTVGILADVGLNVLLIPVMGIEGAALSTLITQLIIQFLLPLIFKGMRECGTEMARGLILWKVLNRDEWNGIRKSFKAMAKKVFRKK